MSYPNRDVFLSKKDELDDRAEWLMIPLTASMSTRDGVFGRDRTKGATMTDDAVRDCAITRKVSEEFFLEQDRQWIVDIRGERLPPESLEDLRGFERGSEEGRKEAEPFFNLRLIFSLTRVSRGLSLICA